MSDSNSTPAQSTTGELIAQEPAFHRYNRDLAQRIEQRWQKHWADHDTFRTPNPGEPGFDGSKPKYFCLDMFPYPSGAGLHVGHPEGYTGTDIICRYMRMQGRNVLHPMGWDAFGLPAEQYAIQTGVHPAETTKKAIDNFRRQLQRFGFSYDWSREIATIDPAYYRWTQWIWLQAYNAWYDPEMGRARPIAELEQEFATGARAPRINPTASEYADTGDMPGGTPLAAWADLNDEIQRMVIDSYRLAYLAVQTVNWCPKLGTALANEEVIDGRSERGGFPVFRKPLKQWMFRITAFADRLLEDLDTVDWPESTRIQQREWIGRSEGAEVDFPLLDVDGNQTGQDLRVFTTRPDTIFGATYMVVAPEHPLVDEALGTPAPETDVSTLRAYVESARNKSDVDRQADTKEKTGVFTGYYATNPATNNPIPIWTSDYVLMGYGHGAIMAVPGHDERDFEFARKFNLPIVRVVEPSERKEDNESWFSDDTTTWDRPYCDAGVSVNSARPHVSLNELPTAEAKHRIIDWLQQSGCGQRKINYKLRDWLFSRQRYWGEPFPIVYDESGIAYPVSDAALPVVLPDMADYQPVESDEPMPLLAKATDWVHTTAGEAGVDPALLDPATPVRRETNTMPGWAGSCWYFLRFCDPGNTERFVGEEAERYWMCSLKSSAKGSVPADAPFHPDTHHIGGVDLYIGGAEHAVLHLLYARFWHKILFDLGHISTPEPFGKLFHQGLICSHAYQRPDRTLVPIDEVDETEEGVFIERATGGRVTQIVAKMSKSLRNVVNPDDIIAEYGADTFRLYEMYMGPLDAMKPWNTRDIVGPFRFLQRVWRLAVDEYSGTLRCVDSADADVERHLHRTIAKVGGDIERLAFNTAIAAMMEFVNTATQASGVTHDQLERFTLILAPFAPHMAEELWHRLGHADSLSHTDWPQHDPAMLVDDAIEMPVQIMGKLRAKVTVPADADRDAIERLVMNDDKVQAQLEGKTIRKLVIVPGKIINIVAN